MTKKKGAKYLHLSKAIYSTSITQGKKSGFIRSLVEMARSSPQEL